jgi:hypothetical protein
MSCRLACNCSQSVCQMHYKMHVQGLRQWKKAIKVSTLDHEAITEEATKHDRLEYEEEDEDKSDEDSEESEESELESK